MTKEGIIVQGDPHLRPVFICHRMPERTFKIGSWYLPVCARCTGLFIGAFLYYTYYFLVKITYTPEIMLFGILAVIPTFLDGLSQDLGYRVSNNLLRFSTGLLGGIGLGIMTTTISWILISWR